MRPCIHAAQALQESSHVHDIAALRGARVVRRRRGRSSHDPLFAIFIPRTMSAFLLIDGCVLRACRANSLANCGHLRIACLQRHRPRSGARMSPAVARAHRRGSPLSRRAMLQHSCALLDQPRLLASLPHVAGSRPLGQDVIHMLRRGWQSGKLQLWKGCHADVCTIVEPRCLGCVAYSYCQGCTLPFLAESQHARTTSLTCRSVLRMSPHWSTVACSDRGKVLPPPSGRATLLSLAKRISRHTGMSSTKRRTRQFSCPPVVGTSSKSRATVDPKRSLRILADMRTSNLNTSRANIVCVDGVASD